VRISSRMLFLCVLSEIIMNVKFLLWDSFEALTSFFIITKVYLLIHPLFQHNQVNKSLLTDTPFIPAQSGKQKSTYWYTLYSSTIGKTKVYLLIHPLFQHNRVNKSLLTDTPFIPAQSGKQKSTYWYTLYSSTIR
jgi:hypothetical protein